MKLYIKQNKIYFINHFNKCNCFFRICVYGCPFATIIRYSRRKNMQQFTGMILFSIVYFAMLGIFLYLQSLLSKKVICRIMRQVRSDVFRGTVNYSIEEFEKRNTADYISIITNDVKMIEDNFLLPFFEIVQYTVIFISSFVLMIYFDIIVTICVIVAIAIMFLIPSLLGGKLEKRQNTFSSKLADFTGSLKDILSGFEIIKSYSMKHM